jgi:hypothetical protein
MARTAVAAVTENSPERDQEMDEMLSEGKTTRNS